MKRLLFIVFTAVMIAACNNKSDQPPAVDGDTAITKYYWEARDTGSISMARVGGMGPDTIAVAPMIRFLNDRWPNVQLLFKKISNDTLFLKIPQATYLTQQMGSSGPREFLAEAAYNLTEIQGIRYVDFDFESGDHAWPETLNRDSFKDK